MSNPFRKSYKHIFKATGHQPMLNLAPDWVGYRCIFCNKISGLDAWQIADMPVDMAKCNKSPVKMGFFEKLSYSINCFKE